MVPLDRSTTPRILQEHQAEWTKSFLEELQNGKATRPRSNRYAHKEITQALRAMSAKKCFYCERGLTEKEEEVDHHLDVAEKPEFAYEWSNLYLSCGQCNNGKPPNAVIAVADCVDPCGSRVDPSQDLTFDDERIEPRNESSKGRNTINKYRLDRQELELARSRSLNAFFKALLLIKERQTREKRSEFTAEEIETIKAFGARHRPFSLMFAVYLRRLFPEFFRV